MPRTTKADLEAENAMLRAELATRDRSRSRRRAALPLATSSCAAAHVEADAMSSASRRALDVVCRHDRDGVIEEQRATIARQAKELADLRVGKGPVGPILALAVQDFPSLVDRAMRRTETVSEWLIRQGEVARELYYALSVGGGPLD